MKNISLFLLLTAAMPVLAMEPNKRKSDKISDGSNINTRLAKKSKIDAGLLQEIENNPLALHDAVLANDIDKAKALLHAGADVNAIENHGNSPLLLNEIEYNKAVCSATPLHYAAKNGHEDIVKLLVRSDADVNAQDNKGETPLHLAAWKGYIEITKQLIDNGAEVNARDKEGWAPIHRAAQSGHEKVIKLLIKSGADLNAQDNEGWTPYHLAAEEGNTKATKLILSSFALPQPVDLKEVLDLKSLALMSVCKKIERFGLASLIQRFENEDYSLSDCYKILPFINLHDQAIKMLLGTVAGETLDNFYKQKHAEQIKQRLVIKNKEGQTVLHIANEDDSKKLIVLLAPLIAKGCL